MLAPAALLRDIRKLAASVLRQVEGDAVEKALKDRDLP